MEENVAMTMYFSLPGNEEVDAMFIYVITIWGRVSRGGHIFALFQKM